MTILDLSTFYKETAKISDLPVYLDKAGKIAGEGNVVVLTGKAPIWLYLTVAHFLHGRAKKLVYRSPVSGDVSIFDHNPF